MSESRGELIGGRYRLVETVGQGGMGRVWRGRDETLQRDVAVKEILFPAGLDDRQREVLLQRVMREARAAAGLNHPGIITVHDVVEHDGAPAIVMEFVVGASLAATVREQGRLPVERVARIGLAVLEALAVAHAAGVVHRDLKPDNILLGGGRVVLTDFGIASMADATMALTSTGTILGTPAYMAPEQLEGDQATAASDMWALGATLYTAVEGGAPFTASTLTALYVAILTHAPRPTVHAGALEPVLAGLLVKDPAERATAERTAQALEGLLVLPSAVSRPGGPVREVHALTAPVTLPDTPAVDHLPTVAATVAPPRVPEAPASERPAYPPAVPGVVPGAAVPAEDVRSQEITPPVDSTETPSTETPSTETPSTETPSTETPSTETPVDRTSPPGPGTPTGSGAVTVDVDGPLDRGRSAGPVRPASRRRTVLLASLGLIAAGVIPTVIALSHLPGRTDQGGRGGGSSPSAGAPPGGSTVFNAALTGVVNPSDKKGGTLNLWTSTDVDSLDPGRAYYASVWNFERFYARTLLAFAAEPGKDGQKLVPDLAAAQPEVSADGRTYTFHLRQGVKFEDGSAITSKDVKYGIERTFAQDVVFGGPTYLVNSLDQGQHYPGPYKDTDPDKLGLKTVTTPDDSTVVFHLAKPESDFPYFLAMGSASPVPQKSDTGAAYGKKPVSSGPYEFSEVDPGKGYELVRNPAWDPATDPFRKALPDVVKLTVATSAADLEGRLLDGSADLDFGQLGLSATSRDEVMADSALKAHADDPYLGSVRYVSVVPKVAPFDDVHCRRAVLYAADTTALQTARGGPAAGSLTGSMLPPAVPGSDDYDPFGLTDGKPDLAKAREELRACGKPDGFRTTIAVRAGRTKEVDSAVALQAALKAVGVDAAVDQYDATRLSSVIGAPDVVHAKGYGLIVMGWSADYPTGAGALQPLVDGRLITSIGNVNYSEIDDPAINALFDGAAAATDPAEAADIYRRIDHEVVDGAYFLPIVVDRGVNYRNPRLTNVYVNAGLGQVDFQALGVPAGG